MLANAGTEVEVSDANETDNAGIVVGQTGEVDTFGQIVSINQFAGHRQVLFNQFIHPPFHLSFFLPCGFAFEGIADFALLALDVCIGGPLTAKHSYHHLIEEMFGRVCGRKFVFIVCA